MLTPDTRHLKPLLGLTGNTDMREFMQRDHLKGFLLASFAGLLWSFGSLIVRYMVAAHSYQWQYLFFRGLTIALVLLIYILAKDGNDLVDRIKRIGISGLIGACGLVAAFSGFIWAITLTTVANTLFMFAAAPFIAAFLGIVFLQEKVRLLTWLAMAIALVGIFVMVLEGLEGGSLFGNLMALVSAVGFAIFSVSLRWRKETPKFTTVALGGVICALLTLVILFLHNESLAMPVRNVYLSILHGSIVGFGLILFSMGAKFLPAAELALLSMMEVVGGVLWVYLPVFGIHEVPSTLTVVGGVILFGAIVLDGVGARQQHMIKIS
jgi:drug/metabolite transporter (DMT)-like permease